MRMAMHQLIQVTSIMGRLNSADDIVHVISF